VLIVLVEEEKKKKRSIVGLDLARFFRKKFSAHTGGGNVVVGMRAAAAACLSKTGNQAMDTDFVFFRRGGPAVRRCAGTRLRDCGTVRA
jgi:hypothetical protein